MEGDAGASRLNPADADDSSFSEVKAEDSKESEVGTDQTTTEVKAEDSKESEVATDQTTTEVKAEDSKESEVATDQTTTEVKAEDSKESEVGTDQTTTEVKAEDSKESEVGTEAESEGVEGSPSRLDRRWFIGITAALVLLAGGVGAGGYLALRAHQHSRTLARDDAAAIQAAKECVSATQAPDTSAMAESARKIIECSTGDFGAQAALYSGLLVDAYQAANARVQVSDMRAAVERNNNDGSIDVLVALRVKVTNAEAKEQESGYRLRVKMASDEGRYKISKLEQVTK
ncbi:putative conserved MCE associated membrane protein [Mycobacterium xenopi 4042]|uniref:Putative conserved MCE associated membrane protein n=1 Tax=Mycobacterium xenopi 4042 TaxID=1299334 RepID=X8BIN7_MYCXE|nr:putative conserved MCE associated membrane protein [Mycobacterium xenopi 4042]